MSTEDTGVTVEDITTRTGDYVGKKVTVIAPIRTTFGERAFTLFAEGRPDDLLAVGADPYPEQQNSGVETGLIQAKSLRVTGVVRRFDRAAVEREAGVELSDERLRAYEGKPVINVKTLQ